MIKFYPVASTAPTRETLELQAAGAAPSSEEGGASKVVSNLINHIPAEAVGFYVFVVESIAKPSRTELFFAFLGALFLLIIVRWLAKATTWVWVTTIAAFVLWMFILDAGFLKALLPDLFPDPWGLIAAMFYSTAVTLLASAGKLSGTRDGLSETPVHAQ